MSHSMHTIHRIVFGDCRTMSEIPDESIQLMVTSPPYFNAPFDYPDLLKDYNDHEWHLTIWNITNVLPLGNRLEKGIAAFPEEIPRRLIKLFSFHGETVLDPFLGSGTTMKVAQELGRNSWGYEIDRELKKVIKRKMENNHQSASKVEFRFRQELKKSRSSASRKRVARSVVVT